MQNLRDIHSSIYQYIEQQYDAWEGVLECFEILAFVLIHTVKKIGPLGGPKSGEIKFYSLVSYNPL